jgi:hypothetical protein
MNCSSGFGYIGRINGYKRMKKADYLLAYAACAKTGKVQT